MKPTPCQSLDDYLAHDLVGDELTRFMAHLDDCPDCARSVSENQRLEALLTGAVQLEPVPAGLRRTVERRLLAARRRRWMAVAVALAAAAALIVWFARQNPPAEMQSPPQQEIVQPKPQKSDSPLPVEQVRVTFPGDANVVAVSEKMPSPNVTFIWVYTGQRGTPLPSGAGEDPPSLQERNDP
jgi:hypothetical protein